MVQKKLPLINSAHGSETRNIINEIIKAINDRGLEILSESSFLNWLYENGIKHQGEWTDTKGYARLSVVLHEGNSYTSVKNVPVGVDILNDEYWIATGNYNAQVEYYREETERVANELGILKVNNLYKSVKDYGAKGDGVTDDSIAIENAINDNKNGNTLLFPNGIYILNDLIYVNGIKKINIIGEQSKIIMNNNGITDVRGLITLEGNINDAEISISGLEFEHSVPRLKEWVSNSIGPMNLNVYKFKKAVIENNIFHESSYIGLQAGMIKGGIINNNKCYNTNYAGIRVMGCENITIENNEVNDIYITKANPSTIGYGITLASAGTFTFGTFTRNKNINIENNKVTNCGRKNIDVHVGENITIKGNIVKDDSDLINVYGLIYALNEADSKQDAYGYANNIIIDGNILEGNFETGQVGGAIYVGNFSNIVEVDSFIIKNNIIKNGHRHNAILVGNAGVINKVSVVDNLVESISPRWSNKCLQVTPGDDPIKNLTVMGNSFNSKYGNLVEIKNVENMNIVNNIIETDSNSGNGLMLTGVNNLIENNNIIKLNNAPSVNLRTYTDVTEYTDQTN